MDHELFDSSCVWMVARYLGGVADGYSIFFLWEKLSTYRLLCRGLFAEILRILKLLLRLFDLEYCGGGQVVFVLLIACL